MQGTFHVQPVTKHLHSTLRTVQWTMPQHRVRKTLLLLAAPLAVTALLILPALFQTPYWQVLQTHSSFHRSPVSCKNVLLSTDLGLRTRTHGMVDC